MLPSLTTIVLFLGSLAPVRSLNYSDLSCEFRGSEEHCKHGSETPFVLECHVQGRETICSDNHGGEFVRGSTMFLRDAFNSSATPSLLLPPEENVDDDDVENEGLDCHYHAGVKHCTGGSSHQSCSAIERKYNVPLRVGALFIILVTSGLAVWSPVLLTKFTRTTTQSLFFVFLKQFGTGTIISTAFVHLMTHAALMFGSECIGALHYEAVTAAFMLAGLFVTFLLEFVTHRIVDSVPTPAAEQEKELTCTVIPAEQITPNSKRNEAMSVLVLELAILFHSVFIGLTTAITPNSAFTQLLIVVIFHQIFEGIALGAKLSESQVSSRGKFLCAGAFTLITPLGVGIGIGVLGTFNGNDPATLWTIAIFDAVSAGMLAWVGIVEFLAGSWIWGELRRAGRGKTYVGMAGLLSGLIIMSVLGKWA